ncbi:tryptophan synthase subunit alpha [Acidicapsa dinghuensis]|uniref:Tryptophan synthase alpha chain n=1 Tax=Acidicapsa dinghuensis TaxID=2218256 RepID=A0ABW1EH39_9BACT|nr:tryptophan synthase subunit alpha [Acidicapsa dinghuensis]
MALRFQQHPGLVAYLTAGDAGLSPGTPVATAGSHVPAHLVVTREIALAAIDAGADVIELGVPFSDPLADGPVIQRASERSLARGIRLRDVLALAKELRQARPNAGLVIFTYVNPVLRFGLKAFADAAAESGADGVLLTDMIVEEASEYIAEMNRVDLAPIFLAAPTSPEERLKAIAAHSKGFIYAISRTGVTGKRQELAADAAALVERIRRWSKLPVAVGFGISHADHVAEVGRFADAAVIGSAIVELIERSTEEQAPGVVARFIEGLRQLHPAQAL